VSYHGGQFVFVLDVAEEAGEYEYVVVG